MALLKVTFALGLILAVCLGNTFAKKDHHHYEMKKRSTESSGLNQDKASQSVPDWKPASGPREFTVNVDDNIQGANQHRHEKWNNGTVTGSYAAPGGRNGKWLKYEYIGDSNGFRITSTKEVTPEELMDGNASAQAHQANININTDHDAPVKYTVTEDQLNAKDKQVKAKQ